MKNVVMHVLQQSIFTETENGIRKWVSADSSLQMAIGITRELIEAFPETYFVIVYTSPFLDIHSPRELFDHPNIHWECLRQPTDPILLRYNFAYEEWHYLFRRFHPNIVWNDIPEITRNMRAALNALGMQKTYLIQCNYWGQFPMIDSWARVDKEVGYEYRQIDGALAADLTPYSCESVREGFLQNARSYLPVPEDIVALSEKSPIWNFGFSKKELDSYFVKAKDFEKKIIVFPNRLAVNDYTNWKAFIAAVNLLYQHRQDFGVVFTNPSQKVSLDWLKEHVKPLYVYKEGPLTREEYITLLWGSHLSCSLYTNERNGGCANVECAYCGALPLMPQMFEYAKRAPEDYPGFIAPTFRPEDLKDRLNYMLTHYDFVYTKYAKQIAERVLESSFESAKKHVVPHLQKMLESERTSS